MQTQTVRQTHTVDNHKQNTKANKQIPTQKRTNIAAVTATIRSGITSGQFPTLHLYLCFKYWPFLVILQV